MTEDRELRQQAIVELIQIRRALRQPEITSETLVTLIVELVDWMHEWLTD